MKTIIETNELSKVYKRYKKREGIYGSLIDLFKREYEYKNALEGISITIGEGEIVGLIGPNGAGKTTLTKLFSGIVAPSSGEINVMGYTPNKLGNEFKKQYAIVMGQKSQLFFELTLNDTLELYKRMYGMDNAEFNKSKTLLISLFEVEKLLNVPVRTLSLGERMKMELIIALLHNPRLLFLDEPTIGLDVIASKQIREFLKKVNEEKGTTIILTSHYMEDIRLLCERSVVLREGKKIYDGSTEKLIEKYQNNRKINVVLKDSIKDMNFLSEYKKLESGDNKISLVVKKENTKDILKEIIKLDPLDISIEEEDIAGVVERIYRGDENE